MSDVIKLLPDSVANQIAAGEVIQRPASVIKELIENSVDAGATEIQVIVRDAGRTLIQVIDNGRGMTETDARMAFERHATSKIQKADDLFSLVTMGFRGEALPSVCAIAQVEVHTRTKDDSIGTRLEISGSRVIAQEPAVCAVGTNIMVKNLFFNVPARRKFLKSDNVELTNVMREFERLALVNNHIRLSIDTGSRKIDLRAGNFKQRIGDIWKNNLNMQLLPVEVDTSIVRISGFISRPEFARRRNALQYLIVNGRNMRHPYFHRAIADCFAPLIASDTQPCYFIKFEVDPKTIDVNIHPTKNEIKFEYEQEIRPILTAAVKAALGKFSAVPSIDFNAEMLPISPLPEGVEPEAPSLGIPEGYNPFDETSAADTWTPQPHRSVDPRYRPTRTDRNWETLYSEFMQQTAPEIASSHDDTPAALPGMETPDTAEASASLCIQFASKYIVTSSAEGLLVIDQHRAHVKILYEQLLRQNSYDRLQAQSVMFAETLQLDPAQQAALGEVEAELRRLGFTLEPGESSGEYSITTVPAMLRRGDPRETVIAILDSVSGDSGSQASAQGMMEKIALLLARSSAIRRGTTLSAADMEHLVSELFSLPDPHHTPDGLPLTAMIGEQSLAPFFTR